MQDNSTKDESAEFARDVWISRAKVAVALSLIKTKPPSLTAEEYTRILAQKIRKWQLSLRSTNATLEDENLRLRQKLTLHELGAGDSGFSNDGEFPMRMSESRPPSEDTPLKEHIIFFQSVLGIKSHLRTLSQQSQEADSTPVDTPCQSLANVFRFLADYRFVTSLPSQTMDDATQTVLTLCDRDRLHDEVATSCLEFAEGLLRSLHQVSLEGQRYYAFLLSLLGQSRHLWAKLCDRLVREVNQFGRRVFREEFDPFLFDAIYATLYSLEVIWGHWTLPDNVKKVVVMEEGWPTMIDRWTSLLESSVRHIWDVLPLFHLYVSFLVTLLHQLRTTLSKYSPSSSLL